MCLTKEKARELIADTKPPKGGWRWSSVKHYPKTSSRITTAQEQAKKEPIEVKKIIKYVNEFLGVLEMKEIEDPELKLPEDFSNWDKEKRKQYVIEKHYTFERGKPKSNNDLVWMKFTKDGFLGVVAVRNDINFRSFRENNTAGIIVHSLGKTWDRSFVLAFPLIGIPKGFKRSDIECGIGNYLIKKGVPILDFYSHKF